jgi:hypothetical protein
MQRQVCQVSPTTLAIHHTASVPCPFRGNPPKFELWCIIHCLQHGGSTTKMMCHSMLMHTSWITRVAPEPFHVGPLALVPVQFDALAAANPGEQWPSLVTHILHAHGNRDACSKHHLPVHHSGQEHYSGTFRYTHKRPPPQEKTAQSSPVPLWVLCIVCPHLHIGCIHRS